MIAARFIRILIGTFVASAVFVGGATEASAGPRAQERWTVLARRVGQSEDFRASAIRELRSRKNLSNELRKGLRSADRPLALEVISALNVKSLVPDMISLVPSDDEGFLILGLNSMMDASNRESILATYRLQLQPETLSRVSPGALVAILEPFGRLGIRLPRGSASSLEKHKTPEVRGALLYYARLMALRHQNFEYADVVERMTRATEYQLRLQAQSIERELDASRTLVRR